MKQATHLTVLAMAAVYVALLLLLAGTVVAAQFPLGAFGLVVALAIAVVKATLVILFFMHLKFERRTVWVFAGAGILWLAILFGLTFSDYLGRRGVGRADGIGGRVAAVQR